MTLIVQRCCKEMYRIDILSILAECSQGPFSGTTFILCQVNGTMECVPDVDIDYVPDNEVKMLA